jgi:hypothetical protein
MTNPANLGLDLGLLFPQEADELHGEVVRQAGDALRLFPHSIASELFRTLHQLFLHALEDVFFSHQIFVKNSCK